MTPDQPSDSALVKRFRGGEARAFEMLVDRYKRPLDVLLYRITSDAHAGEDLLQECFVRLWKHMDDIDADAPVFGYVRRIAVNLALNHLRSRSRRKVATDAAAAASPSRAADASSEHEDLDAQAISSCMQALPEDQRVCLVLRVQEEMSYAEIAEATGAPVGTVMSRISRARSALREMLRARAVL